MRVTVDKIAEGLATYIDRELVPKVPGIRKWILGMSGAYATKIAENMMKENQKILVSAGIMAEDGMVDIDTFVSHLKRSADMNGPVTEHFPLFGDVTFDSSDVDKLYSYIIN